MYGIYLDTHAVTTATLYGSVASAVLAMIMVVPLSMYGMEADLFYTWFACVLFALGCVNLYLYLTRRSVVD